MMRKRTIGFVVLALSICGGGSVSLSTISNLALDDPADGVRAGSPATPSLMESPAAVVQVTAPPPAPAAPAAERVLSANPLWAMPLAQFPATRERPIFSPSRRPPAAAVAPRYGPEDGRCTQAKGARASAAHVGRHHRQRRGRVWDISRSIFQLDDPSKSRRGLSGLEAAIGSGPGNGARKG